MWLFVFYLSHRLVRVCEVELSHMGKQRKSTSDLREKGEPSNSVYKYLKYVRLEVVNINIAEFVK